MNQLIDQQTQLHLLSGQSLDGYEDPGPIVCACFNVGAKAIEKTISQDSCASVQSIGAALRAGTNCGSCIPEIKGLLAVTT